MKNRIDSPIVLLGCRLLSPYIMLFGFYVLIHGHYSPGGGFQGGALLGASFLLMRVAGGDEVARLQLKEHLAQPIAIIGVAIYFLTGLVSILFGGNFLDYSYLPIPGMDPEWLRYTGILIIEVGIGLAVMATFIMIYDNMVRGEQYDD